MGWGQVSRRVYEVGGKWKVCELPGGEQGVVCGPGQFAGWVLVRFTHRQEAIITNDKPC